MKYVADAHIGRLIIQFIQGRGHVVLRATSFPPQTSDAELLNIAANEDRVVITSDKDFGELVFRAGTAAAGVILLRIDVQHEIDRVEVIEQFWDQIESAVVGYFIVVTRKTLRRVPLP